MSLACATANAKIIPKHFLFSINFHVNTKQSSAFRPAKGQLFSKCPFGAIVWTKIPKKKIDKFLS